MIVTEAELDAAHDAYRKTWAGDRNDYFALVYLSKIFKIKQDDLLTNVAFGNNDYGLDAFYLDGRCLFLYQFKWSHDPGLFAASYERLVTAGMERMFGDPQGDTKLNQFLTQLAVSMGDARPNLEQVVLYFVFNGDISRAENSELLSNKQQDLYAKQYLVDEYFGRHVPFQIRYQSNDSRLTATRGPLEKSPRFTIPSEVCSRWAATATGFELFLTPISLSILMAMYKSLGHSLFERNVRYGLSADSSPNRSLYNALADILVRGTGDPDTLMFRHNGITISAEKVQRVDGGVEIFSPRVLNGAQTITTIDRVLSEKKVVLGEYIIGQNNATRENNSRSDLSGLCD